MFIVAYRTASNSYFLRGTCWAFNDDRAARYATQEDAKAALLKAKLFMKPAAFKKAKIEEVE